MSDSAEAKAQVKSATCLRACYAMSGTDVSHAYGATCCAMPATNVAYGATRRYELFLGESTSLQRAPSTLNGRLPAVVLRFCSTSSVLLICYAVSGTGFGLRGRMGGKPLYLPPLARDAMPGADAACDVD
eukprot:3415431-Rhodomonas_salina.3